MWWLILKVVLFVFFKLWFRHLIGSVKTQIKGKTSWSVEDVATVCFSSLSQGKSSPVSGPFFVAYFEIDDYILFSLCFMVMPW